VKKSALASSVIAQTTPPAPTYPRLGESDAVDVSRRKFLGQLVAGSAVVTGIGLLDEISLAQTIPIDPDAIVEYRSLWIEPGYIILVQWSRPSSNLDVVAALDAAVPSLTEYLSSTVTSSQQLHNPSLLHELEASLLTQLQPIVQPAVIIAVHLDHSCATVCDRLNPPEEYPPFEGEKRIAQY
jgi:hypothetical protein